MELRAYLIFLSILFVLLFIPNKVLYASVVDAYWEIESSGQINVNPDSVSENIKVKLVAELDNNASPGDFVVFKIYEDDALNNDLVGFTSGETQYLNGKYVCIQEWFVPWIDDGYGGPEFFFNAKHGSDILGENSSVIQVIENPKSPPLILSNVDKVNDYQSNLNYYAGDELMSDFRSSNSGVYYRIVYDNDENDLDNLIDTQGYNSNYVGLSNMISSYDNVTSYGPVAANPNSIGLVSAIVSDITSIPASISELAMSGVKYISDQLIARTWFPIASAFSSEAWISCPTHLSEPGDINVSLYYKPAAAVIYDYTTPATLAITGPINDDGSNGTKYFQLGNFTIRQERLPSIWSQVVAGEGEALFITPQNPIRLPNQGEYILSFGIDNESRYKTIIVDTNNNTSLLDITLEDIISFHSEEGYFSIDENIYDLKWSLYSESLQGTVSNSISSNIYNYADLPSGKYLINGSGKYNNKDIVFLYQFNWLDSTSNTKTYSLSINKTGDGFGTVISDPSGIFCGDDCSNVFNEEQVITLTAVENGDSSFSGWSGGGCSGTGACTVTLTEDMTVSATFDLTAPVQTNDPITVISPNGGESLVPGHTYRIKWDKDEESYTTVKIELVDVMGGVSITPLATNAQWEYYDWEVPDYYQNQLHKIRITSIATPTNYDESDDFFTITGEPQITVSSPTAGQSFSPGDTIPIRWSTEGDAGNSVEIIWKNRADNADPDNGTIVEGTLNDGSYYWTIPSDFDQGDEFEIRVRSVEYSTYYDYTDEFSIIGLPEQASNTSPALSETDVSVDVILSWEDGDWANSYDVYFGTSESFQKVATVSTTSFDPGVLSKDEVYYWRVDSINSAGTTTGEIWFFNTELTVSAEEREALIALYNATDGDNWTNNSGWLGPEGTECDWYGVGCSDGYLTSLYLRSNQLSGEIPVDLGQLNALKYLELNYNQLTGEIPVELGGLANLQSLYLNANQLSGSIPAELGGLSNLQSLNISSNQLSGGISVELGRMSNLVNLSLNSNQLSGSIPAELGGLTNLRSLYLYSNQLNGEIPAELGGLTNLQSLYSFSNQLSGEIPAELGQLSSLQYLYLDSNQLSGSIPAELGGLTNLRSLKLNSNRLTGQIPAELAGLSNLQSLYLYSNQLNGEIPTDLGQMNNLRILSLSYNELSSEIPVSLGGLGSLEYLQLTANQLSGEVPADLGQLSNLKYLSFDSNQLSGEIPYELTNLTNLSSLYICSNGLYTNNAEVDAFIAEKTGDFNWQDCMFSDSDNDGFFDPYDNCPGAYNPLQEDSDVDGVGDLCEDGDSDGTLDVSDNCPSTYNPFQKDSDEDGIGDLCEDTMDQVVGADLGEAFSALDNALLDNAQENSYLKEAAEFFNLAEQDGGSPDVDIARFSRAMTRVVAIAADTESDLDDTNGLDTMGDILDAFGVPADATTRGTWSNIDLSENLPTDSPESGALLQFVDSKLGDQQSGAINDFDALPEDFNFRWRNGDDNSVIEFDYGDVLFLKSLAKVSLGIIALQQSYDLNYDIDNTELTDPTIEDFLNANPDLGTVANSARLSESKNYLSNGLAEMDAAIDWIIQEDDTQYDDFVQFYNDLDRNWVMPGSREETYEVTRDIAEAKDWIAKVQALLDGPVMVDDHETPDDPGDDTILNLAPLFADDGLNLRALLPTFSGDEATTDVPDDTFGGLLVQDLEIQQELDTDVNNDSIPDFLQDVGFYPELIENKTFQIFVNEQSYEISINSGNTFTSSIPLGIDGSGVWEINSEKQLILTFASQDQQNPDRIMSELEDSYSDEWTYSTQEWNATTQQWEWVVVAGIYEQLSLHNTITRSDGTVVEQYPTWSIDVYTSSPDRDADGVSDEQEIVIGTDPDNPDTDYDGLYDSEDPDPLNAPVELYYANVWNTNYSDGSISTSYGVSVNCENESLGNKVVRVDGPNDYQDYLTDNDYWDFCEFVRDDLSLVPGIYTFTISENGETLVQQSDSFNGEEALPLVDLSTVQWTFMENDPSTSEDDVYRFSWAPVNDTRTYYYRLEVHDPIDYSWVTASSREMKSYAEIPASRLTSGAEYLYRVRVTDADDFQMVHNRSKTNYVSFVANESVNKAMIRSARAYNRKEEDDSDFKALYVDAYGIATDFSQLTVARVTGPNGYVFDFSQEDFDTHWRELEHRFPLSDAEAPSISGLYTFHLQADGVDYYAYDNLTPAVPFSIPETVSYRAREWYSDSILFDWADVGFNGAQYYRVQVENVDTGASHWSPREARNSYSIQADDLMSRIGSGSWRWCVHVYDSSDWSTVRNRTHGPWVDYAVKSLDASVPELSGRPSHRNKVSGTSDYHSIYVWSISEDPDVDISSLTVDGPDGYHKNVLTEGRLFNQTMMDDAYYLLVQSEPMPEGLYTYSLLDDQGHEAKHYNVHSAVPAEPLPIVDYRSINVNRDASGGLRVSWAPIKSPYPVTYVVTFKAVDDYNGDGASDEIYSRYNVSDAHLVVAEDNLVAGPLSLQIQARDCITGSMQNNRSYSVIVGYEGVNFDYSTLEDADNDGWANNVDDNDSDLSVYPFASAWDDYVDSDSDGYADSVDNCPNVSNADQRDVNGDDVGDACDNYDTDSDGLTDAQEYVLGTDPGDADTDDDQVNDLDDNCRFVANTDQLDANDNGIGNACDFDSDTDEDGDTDAEEYVCGSDPDDSASGCSKGMPWLMLLLDDDE